MVLIVRIAIFFPFSSLSRLFLYFFVLFFFILLFLFFVFFLIRNISFST
ncbi:hypothetical protein HMPREF1145_0209 [Oribacterium parvum ACB8]|nr:hypothetical protein HMPREF1145_0209 [Oribacterium parvum ACB8]